MNKINLILCLLFISILSCSSDDDGPKDTSANLLGTWRGTAINYEGVTETTIEGETFRLNYVGEGFDIDYTVTFSENPNVITSDGSYSVDVTVSFFGQSQTQTVEGIDFFESSSWTRNGDEITFVTDGESGTMEIVELTDQSLILSGSTARDLAQDGGLGFTELDAVIKFVRE